MLFLLPRNGAPALVAYAQTEKVLDRTCPGAHFYGYEDVPFPLSVLLAAFRESGLDRAQIGMEFGPNERLGLSFQHFQELADGLPSCRFVDGGGLLNRLRSIKSPLEVEMISEACRISLTAWERSLPRFRLGMPNNQIQQIVASELCLAGSHFDVPGHVTAGNGVAGGEGGYQPGEVIWCDFGGTWGGYQADLARRAVFGPASPQQLEDHARIFEMLEHEIDSIGPGKRASDVARQVSHRLEEEGYPPLGPKKRVGHGLGLSSGEPPSLSLADDTLLEPGMVLTPEPRFNLESGERVHIEEVVLVTAEGCRKLTQGADKLEILA